MSPPVVIALPQGLTLSGITSWALRLAGGLARAGRGVALVVHPDQGPSMSEPIPPGVRHVRLEGVPPLDQCRGDYSLFLPAYLGAIDGLASAGPVVAIPTLSSESVGLFAAITHERPGRLRVLSWTHNDIEHDYRVAEHYEPLFSGFVGVSTHITRTLRERMPARARDAIALPYGVDSPPFTPRPPLAGRPLQLIYTGRLEHHQKRVLALPHLSRALTAQGIEHAIHVVGDGPAANDLTRESRDLRTIHRHPALDLAQIRAILQSCDVFVLPSRFEGLSISMLEAMAAGCVPVATHVDSGVDDAVDTGVSGVLVEPIGFEERVGGALAEGVRAALERGLAGMAQSAWTSARARFSLDAHLADAGALFDRLARNPARDWPADSPVAATGLDGFGFSVPPDAPLNAQVALARLGGKRVALWGAGRHTQAIALELDRTPARVVAIIDDDPQKQGDTLARLPIIPPRDAPSLGVTDAVISSHMHEDALWERRNELERLGVRVHRMYGRPAA